MRNAILLPYDTLDFAGDYAPNAANFSALKHQIDFSEGLGATALYDKVGDLILPVTALTAGTIANTFKIPSTAVIIPTSGSFVPFNTAKTTVIVAVGQYPANTATIGIGGALASGARAILQSSLTAPYVVDDATAPVTLQAAAALNGYSAVPAGLALVIESGGYVRSYASTLTTNFAGSASAGLVSTLGGAGSTANWGIANKLLNGNANSNHGLIQIWQFSSTVVPADVISMLAWTTALLHSSGKRYAYPGWKGKV